MKSEEFQELTLKVKAKSVVDRAKEMGVPETIDPESVLGRSATYYIARLSIGLRRLSANIDDFARNIPLDHKASKWTHEHFQQDHYPPTRRLVHTVSHGINIGRANVYYASTELFPDEDQNYLVLCALGLLSQSQNDELVLDLNMQKFTPGAQPL